jgi:nitrate/TMAO reductase-like tetraheme cytochrome c subunit
VSQQIDSHTRRSKLIFLMVAGTIGIMLLVVGTYQLVEFTDSTAFCGRLCHNVMYPEYTAYQASPHSRVTCSECHVGSGADYLVRSKLSGIPLIITTIAETYDRPIPVPVENLRPARETCEQCHRPEVFSGDIVRVHTTFLPDEANTPKVDTRVMHVGGGETGVARDIHWHIAAKVWYLALDKQRQEIAWVGVENDTGEITMEYIDPNKAAEITPERIQNEKRLMDCIDCHNRATHIFQSPEELVDEALVQGKIDTDLPYIKRESVEALDPPNASLDEAYVKVKAITDFYRTNYPQVYSEKKEEIDKAIDELKEIARLTTFPFMKVTYETYLDNLDHIKAPSCMRCHGKLIATSGEQKGRAINVHCNLCHDIMSP